MKKTVITIGRQFCSGGHDIGEKLAEELNIPFYDKNLISLAAKKSGMSEEVLKAADEYPTDSLLYNLSLGNALFAFGDMSSREMPVTDKLFILQSEIIKNAANEGSCVIVGRCAENVLEGRKDCISVFIYADMDYKIQRCIDVYKIAPEKAKSFINKTDKRRESYHNYFCDTKWGSPESYDMMLNSSKMSEREIIDVIKAYIESKE